MALASMGASLRDAVRAFTTTYARARQTAQAAPRWTSRPEPEAFAKFYRSARIDPNLVFYESYSGASMACNPYAIFRELLTDPAYPHLTHVWALDSEEEIRLRSREYAAHPNVRFIADHGPEYLRTITTAKYLIQNSTFRAYFAKHPDQVFLSTWHSAGAVKRMGFDLHDGNYEARNTLRNFLMADYISSPNELMTSLFTDAFRLRGLYGGKLLQCGYPRHDVTLTTSRTEVIDELRMRGVTVDPGKEIVLYAPTFRGFVGSTRGSARELDELRNGLAAGIDTDRYQILVKPHTFHYSRLTREQKASGQFIPRQVNADRLLAAVDVLVSDYSSIFFDFMATGRPVLFYLPDLADYTAERGIYFSPEDLPGPSTADAGEVARWINDLESVRASYADIYARLRSRVLPFDDARAARRTVDAVFGGQQVPGVIADLTDPDRKRILLHAHDLDNSGATRAVLTLAKRLDRRKYDVTVAGIGPTPESRANVEHFADTRVLARIGPPALTRWERYGFEYVRRYGLAGPLLTLLRPDRMLRREWRRAFGEARFDAVIELARYPGVFSWTAAAGGQPALAVWQHTDLVADLRNQAKWRLTEAGAAPITEAALSALYRRADAVVAPSQGLVELIASRFAAAGSKVTYAPSPVDEDRVRRLLDDAAALQDAGPPRTIVAERVVGEDGSVRSLLLPDFPPAPDSGDPYRRFVTMGCLSPEKNLANLIAAFAAFVVDHPNSRLFVIGSGAAAADLKKLAARPDLNPRVSFTGYLRNPFTVLRSSDCFVLPSRYEGFNLSVPEARLAGLPVILGPFPSASPSAGGRLAGFGVEEILAGLHAFADGSVHREPGFDAVAHNADALARWERLIDSL